MKKRSNLNIMLRLIGLVKPLTGFMILAILIVEPLGERSEVVEKMACSRTVPYVYTWRTQQAL